MNWTCLLLHSLSTAGTLPTFLRRYYPDQVQRVEGSPSLSRKTAPLVVQSRYELNYQYTLHPP